jgi:hypothetical protein
MLEQLQGIIIEQHVSATLKHERLMDKMLVPHKTLRDYWINVSAAGTAACYYWTICRFYIET